MALFKRVIQHDTELGHNNFERGGYTLKSQRCRDQNQNQIYDPALDSLKFIKFPV